MTLPSQRKEVENTWNSSTSISFIGVFLKAGTVQGEVLIQEPADLNSILGSIGDERSPEQASSLLQGSGDPSSLHPNFRGKDHDLEWLYRALHNKAAPLFWGRALPTPV